MNRRVRRFTAALALAGSAFLVSAVIDTVTEPLDSTWSITANPGDSTWRILDADIDANVDGAGVAAEVTVVLPQDSTW